MITWPSLRIKSHTFKSIKDKTHKNKSQSQQQKITNKSFPQLIYQPHTPPHAYTAFPTFSLPFSYAFSSRCALTKSLDFQNISHTQYSNAALNLVFIRQSKVFRTFGGWSGLRESGHGPSCSSWFCWRFGDETCSSRCGNDAFGLLPLILMRLVLESWKIIIC